MKDLKRIRIKNPCTENWDAMRGDERSRFCDQCETKVVNLSAMTPREVDELAAMEKGFCIRYVAKPDGTPILRSSRRRSFLRRLAVVLSVFLPALAAGCRDDSEEEEEEEERVGNGSVQFMGLE